MADDDFENPMPNVAPGRRGVDPAATTPPGDWGEPPSELALPPTETLPGEHSPAIPIPTDPYIFPRSGIQPVSETGIFTMENAFGDPRFQPIAPIDGVPQGDGA